MEVESLSEGGPEMGGEGGGDGWGEGGVQEGSALAAIMAYALLTGAFYCLNLLSKWILKC